MISPRFAPEELRDKVDKLCSAGLGIIRMNAFLIKLSCGLAAAATLLLCLNLVIQFQILGVLQDLRPPAPNQQLPITNNTATASPTIYAGDSSQQFAEFVTVSDIVERYPVTDETVYEKWIPAWQAAGEQVEKINGRWSIPRSAAENPPIIGREPADSQWFSQ